MFKNTLDNGNKCLYSLRTASNDAMKENKIMNGRYEFCEQLALLGVSAKEDEQFKLGAMYIKKTNEVIYNPCLLTQKRVSAIISYITTIHK